MDNMRTRSFSSGCNKKKKENSEIKKEKKKIKRDAVDRSMDVRNWAENRIEAFYEE